MKKKNQPKQGSEEVDVLVGFIVFLFGCNQYRSQHNEAMDFRRIIRAQKQYNAIHAEARNDKQKNMHTKS